VDSTQSGGHGLERRRDGGMPHWLGLELREGALEVGERSLGVRRGLRPAGALDLMQRPHRLRDGRRELEQRGRDVRIPLKRAKPSRKRLSRGSR